MQLAWLSEQIKKEATSQGGAEEIRMILPRKRKNPTKGLPENTGYLGRQEKDMRREEVISGTETAGIILKI